MVAWGTENDWGWCDKCQGVWCTRIRVNGQGGVCPAGGGHVVSGSPIYSLVRNANPTPPNHEANWRRCGKCQALFFGEHVATSLCPADYQTHVPADAASYALVLNSGAGSVGWRWCQKCQGLWLGVAQAFSRCPRDGGQHSALNSGDYHLPTVEWGINVHTKALSIPNVPFATLFQNMREVYATANIDVQWLTDEILDLPDLDVLEIGDCLPSSLTSEQLSLFSHRNHVAGITIAVYCVFSTNRISNGCAACPPDKPSAVIVQDGSPWTMAHEIGHVLGLPHCDSPGNRLQGRLMTGGGTDVVDNPPPDLIWSEMTTMFASPFIHALKPY
jgi:hypothetical protein